MCRQVQCSSCGKATFAGCGRHVEQVLAHVRPADRCQCREQPPAKTERKRRSWWPF
jgi:hypothetical protein